MGALRLFLALCVLNLHYQFSDGPLFVHSLTPVCIFFIISGFYMFLFLDRKYAGRLPHRIELVSVPILSAVLLAGDQPVEALRRRIDGHKHAPTDVLDQSPATTLDAPTAS